MSERPDPDYVEPVPDDAESPAYQDDDETDAEESRSEINPFHEDLEFPQPVSKS